MKLKTLKQRLTFTKTSFIQSIDRVKRIKPIPQISREEIIDKVKRIKQIPKISRENILIKLNFFRKAFEKSQDLLERSINNEKEEILLKQSPYWARAISWTLISGSVLGIAWLSLAKTEEIIIVQGKLEPISKVIDVQVPIGGVIEKVLIKEGQIVEEGQILITLDKEITQNNIDATKEVLNLNEEILNKFEKLADAGAISQIQFLQQKIKVSEIQNELKTQEVTLKYQELKSPIRGKVFELKPRVKGFVAQTSEPMLKIVPLDNLKAKIEIENRHIGFVGTGKKTDISIDSFPASDFGVIKGVIDSIGSDALPPDPSQGKGYRFPATIRLENQYLELKNGNKLPIQVGMSLTANVKLRQVSYLQLLLGTFQSKADSLRSL